MGCLGYLEMFHTLIQRPHLSHPITHKSPIVELPGITGTLDEDGNLLHAQPNRPGTRFTIVLSAQKAAALGNQAHHGIERGRLLGHGLFVQDERCSPLVGLEQQVCR